jgi:hypothetical protein
MRKLLALFFAFTCPATFAASAATYLSCPGVDKIADDLVVVLDQQAGTASLQSAKSGAGLNFVSPASFGPKEVIWRNQSDRYPQKFTVDRVTLTLKRETTSTMTDNVYVESSPCTIVKQATGAKF